MKILRLLRVVKMLRLPSMLRRLENFIGRDVVRFVQLLLGLLLILHLISCFFYYMSYLGGNGPDTWVGGAGLSDASNFDRCVRVVVGR